MSSSSRPLAALASLVLAVLGFVFLIPDCAFACLCVGAEGSKKEIVKDALADSEAVFSGEVVKIDRPSGPGWNTADLETDTFRVSESWKGPEGSMLEVRTQVSGASCGYPFKEGQEYLVYAYEGEQGLKVDGCGATSPLSKAGADLKLLGNSSEKPKDGSNDDALTDTSGGVSARAIAGMAGLLMAASLLVVVRIVRTG
jgi:hypothetical protein